MGQIASQGVLKMKSQWEVTRNNMIAVISHDAGGAEILSSYLKKQDIDCSCVLDGPAIKIFERKIGHVEILSLEDAIHKADWIFCGTSWQSDLEYRAIKLARMLGKHSVSFLDHWVNYRDRFIRLGKICLPDEIWVGDDMAIIMANEVFPDTPISLVENPYFQDIRQELAAIPMRPLSASGAISALYVCEPIREHALLRFGDERHWGYVEEEALRYFLSHVSALGKPVERILIRPHPSELAEKYSWTQREFDLPIEMGGTRTLLEEIADSDIVAGCESMAMVVALLAGKKVLCCIPPGGHACSLPHAEIISLGVLIETGGQADSRMVEPVHG